MVRRSMTITVTRKRFSRRPFRLPQSSGLRLSTVRIGKLDDRFLEDGIQPRIDASVKVLKALRSRALDAGVKFGFREPRR